MASLEELFDDEQDGKKDDQDDKDKKGEKLEQNGDAKMTDADGEKKEDEKKDEEDVIDVEVLNSATRDIIVRRRMIENEIRIMKSEFGRLDHDKRTMQDKIKDNVEKIDNNRYCFVMLKMV